MCDQGVAGSKGRGCTCRGIPAFIILLLAIMAIMMVMMVMMILLLAIMAIMMMMMVSIDGNDNDDEYFTIAFTDPGMIRKHTLCTVSLNCNQCNS